MPELDSPTFTGAYKPVGPDPTFTFPTPVPPAVLARKRKDQKINAKRREGTQALQTIKGPVPIANMPAPIPGTASPLNTGIKPTVPVAAAKAPPPAPQLGNATDPYIAALQNAQKADQALLSHPYQAPEYKPPNKGMEYIAAGLALLFPGAPIANAASGLLQGMQQGADARYARQEQQAEQTQTGLEKTATVANTMADAQAAIQARLEAIRERRAEAAQRNAAAMSSLQEKHQEFIQSFPLKSALAQSLIRFRIGELANQVARNTITQQDAANRLDITMKIAKLQQAGLEGRNAGDSAVKLAVAQTQAIDRQLDSQLRVLDAGVAADTTGQEAIEAQKTAAALIDQASSQVQTILDGVSSGRPDINDANKPPKKTPVVKTLSKADAIAIGRQHGWTPEESVKKAESLGYTVTP